MMMPDRLRPYLLGSTIFHIFLFLILVFSPKLFFPKAFLNKREKVTWITLPKGSTETFGAPKDTKALPQHTIEQQKKALEHKADQTDDKAKKFVEKPGETEPQKKLPPPPESKVKPSNKDPVSLAKPKAKPKKSARDQAIEKALAGLKQAARSKKVDQETAQTKTDLPGGGFAAGSNNPNSVMPNDPEYVMYQMKIRKSIMDQWIIPAKYADGNYQLICRLVVHINERGEVVKMEWEQPSRNEAFDQSAVRAVQRSSPLPIPPDRLKPEAFAEGFLIEFNPQTVAR